jgi:Bacterial SH3 domain
MEAGPTWKRLGRDDGLWNTVRRSSLSLFVRRTQHLAKNGGNMSSSIRFLLLFTVFCFVLPASGADKDTLVCGANQERVWVYSSLTSFDVTMKLKCGETVEIIGRLKGFVKVRTLSGQDGYVPDSALPNLPPFEDSNDKLVASNSSTRPLPSRSVVQPVPATTKSATASPKPVATVPVNVTPVSSKPVVPISSANPSDSAHSEANVTVSADASSSPPGSPAKAASSASKTKTALAPAAKEGAETARATSTHSTVTAPDIVLSADLSSTTSTAALAVASSTKPVSHDSGVAHAPLNATARPVSTSADPDEDVDPPPFKTGDNSACQVYFSAYGLSANQYRWFMQNRKKNHPTVCPAPAPALVDFVIIFTHDVDFFSYTMPTTFHTDKNGFSDFTPLVTIDTAAISQSEADKARHHYVWVFHTTRGAFDPAKFSPRRQPLFTKGESNLFGSRAADRTVEDALAFIEGHAATR